MPKRILQQSKSIVAAKEELIRSSEARNLSHRTIEFYDDRLNSFVTFLGEKTSLDNITLDDINAFLVSLKDKGLSPGSIAGYGRAIKRLLKFHNIPINIDKVKQPKKRITPFSKEQIKKLLAAPDKKTFSGLRDFTIMLLMLDCGTRVSELLGLTKDKINLRGWSISVMGKGGKERTIPIGEASVSALKNYLAQIEDIPNNEPIFVSVYNEPMDRHGVWRKINNYGKKAGITGVRVSPHTFRHTFAKMFLLNGGDIESLQKMMGHETMNMVKEYLNLIDEDVARQHRKYSPADSIIRRRRR